MLCGAMSAKRAKDGSVPVFLNVYDLTSINGYAYWLGLGVYHSGVQVHGMEYAFGSHERETTGIFEGEPKQCEGFAFRKQILVGWTEKNKKEVRKVMQDLAGSLCNCIIPGSLSSTRVGIEDNKMYNEGEMKTKLRSRSSRFASFSSSSLLYEKSSFSSPPVARTRSHRNRDSSSSSSSSS
uniref:deSI-like protein At4g17486 isoform X2 n=1 Tax=Erigeron canadensis TaxID=72917 RepID=UPI001CB9857D|nr:deSI-like protein At4g17486 isoform X2 [Erigeron canadensis]